VGEEVVAVEGCSMVRRLEFGRIVVVVVVVVVVVMH
jgi:hypothetical protein